MLQDLAHWAPCVWAQDKSKPRHEPIFKVSLSVLHSGTSPLSPIHAHQTGHQPQQQQWARLQPSLFRIVKSQPAPPRHLAMLWHHLLAPAQCRPPPLALAQEATGAGLPGLAPPPAPTEPAGQLTPAGCSGGEGPCSAPPLSPHSAHAKRPPPSLLSSSTVSALATEGGSPRPYNYSGKTSYGTCTWHPECGAGCPPGEGKAWGEVRQLQASVFRAPVVHLPPRFHHPPHSSGPTMARMPMAPWPVFLQALPSGVLGGCWGSHGQLSSYSSIQGRLGPATGILGDSGAGMGGEDGW